MTWPSVPLEKLYGEPSRNGLTRPKSVRGAGYKMVNMGELFAYDRLRNPEMERVSMSEPEIQKFSLHAGDLLFARQSLIASGAGKCSIVLLVPELTTFESHIIRVRLEIERVDPLFYYYYFNSAQGKGNVQSLVMQVAAAGIRGSELAHLQVPYPPLPTQCRIASILGAYDDLIENNLRRIRILEEMARLLYKEWFVDFRFPGHEKHGPRPASNEACKPTRPNTPGWIPSPLGPIPTGWEAHPFRTLLLSMTGGDWGSEESQDKDTEEVVVIRGTDFTEVANGGELRVPTRFITPSSLATRLIIEHDVIVENSVNAKSRCIGTTLLVDRNVLDRVGRSAIAASFCKVFRFHNTRVAPLAHMHARYLRSEHLMEYYQNIATNGIGNFQAQRFAETECLVLPFDEGHLDHLSGQIADLLRTASVFASQVSNLRRTRDFLLPKLVSGEVALRNAEALPEESCTLVSTSPDACDLRKKGGRNA